MYPPAQSKMGKLETRTHGMQQYMYHRYQMAILPENITIFLGPKRSCTLGRMMDLWGYIKLTLSWGDFLNL